MEFIAGLLMLVLIVYLLWSTWIAMIGSATDIAKYVVKQAIREVKEEDSGDWDDIK